MKRNALINLLTAYIPTRDEVSFKQLMLDFIAKYPDCFERSLPIGHITASCWLVNKENTHFLLTHHAKLNRWFQLGGHCDGNPDVLATAIKEAQEESGIQAIEPVSDAIFDIDIHLIPSNAKEAAHFHFDVRFLLQVKSDEQIVLSDESHDLKWVKKGEDDLLVHNPAMVRMYNKWMQL